MLFTGEWVIRAIRDNHHQRAVELIDWCTNYFDKRFINEWIRRHGGWVGTSSAANQNH